MNTLTPLETLFDIGYGRDLPLPSELVKLYGQLRFPSHPDGSYVIGNFVSTLDGVVTLGQPGKSRGGDISGYNQHDQMVMGLLRAIADAVIVGSGPLRAAPRNLWTAQYIYPALADAYQELRSTLGKTQPPLNVIVTARGQINLNRPVFQSGEVPVLIVTIPQGAEHIHEQSLPPAVQVSAVTGTDVLS